MTTYKHNMFITQLLREISLHVILYRIPSPIKTVILCYGVALGSDKEWNFLLNIYTNNTNEEERNQLAYAMSCSKDPWILTRWLWTTYLESSWWKSAINKPKGEKSNCATITINKYLCIINLESYRILIPFI